MYSRTARRKLSATGTPKITSEINVPDSLNINLVTIPILKGTHDFIADLSVSIQSPSGDSVLLWSNQCNNLSNFNLVFSGVGRAGAALGEGFREGVSHRDWWSERSQRESGRARTSEMALVAFDTDA